MYKDTVEVEYTNGIKELFYGEADVPPAIYIECKQGLIFINNYPKNKQTYINLNSVVKLEKVTEID